MVKYSFCCVISNEDKVESEEEKEAIKKVKESIHPITITQGSADWHTARKFSVTSLQGHSTFKAAFPLYCRKDSWMTVAEHLYGPEWSKNLNCGQHDQEESHEQMK